MCDSTGLNKTLVSGILLGSGNINSEIMFIGQNPSVVRYSKDDKIFGNPLVSNTDRVFCDGLASIDLKREDVYVTNFVKGSTFENRVPSVDETIHGLSHLSNEIYIIKPKIIVCVGAFVCDNFNIRIGQIDTRDYVYFGINHPTAVVRGNLTLEEYILQWHKLRELINSSKSVVSLKKWLT